MMVRLIHDKYRGPCVLLATRTFSLLWCCGTNAGHGLLIHEVSRSHTTTHHSR